MKIAKSAVVSLVAAGLVAAPVSAQAAPVRVPSQVSESEELAGASFVLYLALAAAAAALLVFVVLDDDDDTDGLPASP
ncbi:MAG: hypothetical protein ACO1OD_04185 [Croceibacterium sp.]